MAFREVQRDAMGWLAEVSGYAPVAFVYDGSPAISVEGKMHYYTAECTYVDLFLIVAPFLWVFDASASRNIWRIAIAALLILGGNLMRTWAALYLDVHGVDRFYAHDLPDYVIWWPTVAVVVVLALGRDFGHAGSTDKNRGILESERCRMGDVCGDA